MIQSLERFGASDDGAYHQVSCLNEKNRRHVSALESLFREDPTREEHLRAALWRERAKRFWRSKYARSFTHTHEYVDVRKKVNRKMIAGFSSENRDDALDQRFVRRATIHHRLWFFHFLLFFYYYYF